MRWLLKRFAMHKTAEGNLKDLFFKLTDLWQDGHYAQVADFISQSETFSSRANLIDFCVFLSKYLGFKELQVLQKLI